MSGGKCIQKLKFLQKDIRIATCREMYRNVKTSEEKQMSTKRQRYRLWQLGGSRKNRIVVMSIELDRSSKCGYLKRQGRDFKRKVLKVARQYFTIASQPRRYTSSLFGSIVCYFCRLPTHQQDACATHEIQGHDPFLCSGTLAVLWGLVFFLGGSLAASPTRTEPVPSLAKRVEGLPGEQ